LVEISSSQKNFPSGAAEHLEVNFWHTIPDRISAWDSEGIMAFSMGSMANFVALVLWKSGVAFAANPAEIEQIALRWMHIVAAIIWLGFLFFFVLAVAPTLKVLDPATRAKVFPEIASRGLWWLRWSSVVAWLAGFRYFMILAKTDAINAGRPHAWLAWMGIWVACWLAALRC
jgi:hypothetical protein